MNIFKFITEELKKNKEDIESKILLFDEKMKTEPSYSHMIALTYNLVDESFEVSDVTATHPIYKENEQFYVGGGVIPYILLNIYEMENVRTSFSDEFEESFNIVVEQIAKLPTPVEDSNVKMNTLMGDVFGIIDDDELYVGENEKINDSAIFDSLYNNAEIASIETAATTYSFFYDDIKDNYPSKDDILNKFAYKLFYKLFIFEEPKEFNKEHFLKQLRDFSNKLSFSTYKQEYEKLNELISELDIKDGTTSNIDKLIIAYLNN